MKDQVLIGIGLLAGLITFMVTTRAIPIMINMETRGAPGLQFTVTWEHYQRVIEATRGEEIRTSIRGPRHELTWGAIKVVAINLDEVTYA